MTRWKWLGLAGVAGVAASGALLARQERKRRAYTPEEVRARLHEKAAEDHALHSRGESANMEVALRPFEC